MRKVEEKEGEKREKGGDKEGKRWKNEEKRGKRGERRGHAPAPASTEGTKEPPANKKPLSVQKKKNLENFSSHRESGAAPLGLNPNANFQRWRGLEKSQPMEGLGGRVPLRNVNLP